ncbi:MAG: phage terminase small subunit-related protein [Cetobacterium sp.]|uniref:phage terminase small subunit-related protein n=1 Tax=Cetobacterium sp. TaxID=2071632 RepID=UPI003F29FA8E
MARERDPARDKAYEMWKEKGGEKANKGILKEIADKLKISEGTVRGWKSKDNWNGNAPKKTTERSNKKKIKEVAKTLIEEGHTLSEVANQTELHPSTLKRMSSKENLQQSQLEHLKRFREKYKEKIERNKLLRLETNEEALEAISYEIKSWENNGKISKAAMEKLIMNEEAEQLILEVDRIERMEKNITDVPVDEEKKKELVIKVVE